MKKVICTPEEAEKIRKEQAKYIAGFLTAQGHLDEVKLLPNAKSQRQFDGAEDAFTEYLATQRRFEKGEDPESKLNKFFDTDPPIKAWANAKSKTIQSLFNLPSEMVDPKIYKRVTDPLLKWYKKNAPYEGGGMKLSFRNNYEKPLVGYVEALDEAILKSNSKQQLRLNLAKAGLDIEPEKIQATRAWILGIVNEFSPRPKNELDDDEITSGFFKLMDRVASARFIADLNVTFGNINELGTKGFGLYPKEFFPAFKKLLDDTKGNIFAEIQEIKDKGYYGVESFLSGDKKDRWYDTMQKSQRVLTNLSYYIGKEAGNVEKAINEVAFASNPFNKPRYQQYKKGSKQSALFRVMHYTIAANRTYYSLFSRALNAKVPEDERNQAVKQLVGWTAMNAALYGPAAAVPGVLAPLYQQWRKENEYEDPILGGKWKGIVGEITGVDMSQYFGFPGAPGFFVDIQMFLRWMDTQGRLANKAMAKFNDGDYEAAAIATLPALLTLAEAGPLKTKYGQIPQVPRQLADAVTEWVKPYLKDDNLRFQELFDNMPEDFERVLKTETFGKKNIELTKKIDKASDKDEADENDDEKDEGEK